MSIFPFKFKREKIKVRVVTKHSVDIPIRKPFVLKGAFLSIFVGILFSGLFSYGVYVFANPPASPYAPGTTLDPLCTPGSVNCTVSPPLYISNNTLDISPNSFSAGNPLRVKYNTSNYATLTVGSNGDLTISTNSSGGGGNINFNSPTSSNATILSNSGILTLGGGISGDGNLNLDFHDYSNKVVVTSGTGVSSIDFGSMNLSTTGVLTLGGSTTGTLVTRVSSGAPTESDTNGSLVVDNAGGRLYFRYGNSWHYIAQTGGFQIPNFETVDPISGEPIKEGDFVVGVIDKSLEDNALHGVWVRWDTLKKQLADELALTGGLTVSSTSNSTSTVSGEETQLTTDSTSQSSQSTLGDSLLDKVKNVLSVIGITIKNGITNITNLTVENFQAKTAKIEKLELVDSATGDIYCTWIENGEWKKEKGECGSIQVAVNNSNTNQAIQNTADQAAQNAVDKVDNVIQKKVEQEVQNQLGSQQNNSPVLQEQTSSQNPENQTGNGSSNNNNQPPSEGNQNEQVKNQENSNSSGESGQAPESSPAATSPVDVLIQNSTSALFDRMNLLVKSLIENTKGLSAGLMEPLNYLIESLFSATKGGVSNASGSLYYSVAGFSEGFNKNSFGEYLWIYSPKGIAIEAQSDLSNLSKKSVVLQRFLEDRVSHLSTNIFFGTMNIKESLFASLYK